MREIGIVFFEVRPYPESTICKEYEKGYSHNINDWSAALAESPQK
jgi:hypothetical protein